MYYGMSIKQIFLWVLLQLDGVSSLGIKIIDKLTGISDLITRKSAKLNFRSGLLK